MTQYKKGSFYKVPNNSDNSWVVVEILLIDEQKNMATGAPAGGIKLDSMPEAIELPDYKFSFDEAMSKAV